MSCFWLASSASTQSGRVCGSGPAALGAGEKPSLLLSYEGSAFPPWRPVNASRPAGWAGSWKASGPPSLSTPFPLSSFLCQPHLP